MMALHIFGNMSELSGKKNIYTDSFADSQAGH